MEGPCKGKMRSTPPPAEILRTVKVSLMPPPRRAMQMPSNACRRSFSPSRTRTITRTVSHGSNAGMFVIKPSRSIALNRSIPSPSLFLGMPGPQVGPALARQPLGFPRAPRRDLLVVATQQYRGHVHPAIARRPRVARRGEQPVLVRNGRRGPLVPERARQEAHHRVDHAQRPRLAARQHENADRQLFRAQAVPPPPVPGPVL